MTLNKTTTAEVKTTEFSSSSFWTSKQVIIDWLIFFFLWFLQQHFLIGLSNDVRLLSGTLLILLLISSAS